ncbi:MAG: nitroreductase family deazaflavin-dependent oxidoreductase, partial [Novosphingobium sp.]|nr:nitroreductase family deazaflavin-dependent oxidoreductase [Novosphingobium sp.]
MSDDKVTMTEVERATLEFVTQHRSNYIASGGAQGHILDYTNLGGHFFTTTMLLETIGRKTGNRHVTPLIYGDIGGEVA